MVASALLKRLRHVLEQEFQSPSLRGSGRFSLWWQPWRWSPPRFNPLHCGAVVASAAEAPPARVGKRRFNPLHCGAVVASRGRAHARPCASGFNPLHCGAVVASPERRSRLENQLEVSIPFIAGQWSLHAESLIKRLRNIVFQSPSLRGSGRFKRLGNQLESLARFQSPSLRGSGRFRRRSSPPPCSPYGFQSPSLRGSGRF